MPRFYLRLTLLPIIIFTVMLLLIRAQPYDDHELRQLLLHDECIAPCFMGIKTGVTTVDEAIKILEASGWVENMVQDTGTMNFIWNGKQPSLLSKQEGIVLYVRLNEFKTVNYQQPVYGITIPTQIKYGELYFLLGGIPYSSYPKSQKINRAGSIGSIQTYDYLTTQYSTGMAVKAAVGCAPDPTAFWSAHIEISFGAPAFSSAAKTLCPF